MSPERKLTLLMIVMAIPHALGALVETVGRSEILKNDAGESTISGVIVIVLAIVIAAILWGNVGPTSINTIEKSRNASWQSGTLAVYDQTGLFYALAGMLLPLALVARYFF